MTRSKQNKICFKENLGVRMKKNVNILATLVLAFGLTAPAGIQAAGFFQNAAEFFGYTAAGSAGVEIGSAAGRGAAHHIGEMIPKGARGPIAVIGVAAVVAYLIYASREDSSAKNRNTRRAKSCSHKNCSSTDCK